MGALSTSTISIAQARRVALAAQGFGGSRSGAADWRAVGRCISAMGVLQIDSVSVLTRSHYLPVFSRLGPYPVGALEERAWGARPKRALFEYWGHMASLLPLDAHPLMRWRMERAARGEGTYGGLARFGREHRAYIDTVLSQVRDRGPLTVRELEDPGRRSGNWWGWGSGKAALEWLFWAGAVTVSTRRGFERVYDLPERVLPEAILSAPTPAEGDAQRELVRLAATALGVATAADLADYFRLKTVQARRAAEELVEAGDLEPVAVEGWRDRAYVARGARRPRAMAACALVSPFDPIVWDRRRTQRLFGFHYRIGIYTPAAERTHGYYVLPFLLGESIAARVDLKADRAAGVLRAPGVHLEPGWTAEAVGRPLAEELRRMAGWLELGEVVVGGRRALARAIVAELKRL